MMRKLPIFLASLVAILCIPASAFASVSPPSGGSGWAGIVMLGAAVAGAAVKLAADEDEPDEGPEGEAPKGAQPSSVCAGCGMQNRPEAKFCDQCSQSMAAPPLEGDGDEAPPSSKKPGAVSFAAPRKVSAESTVAAILGASSESVPAVKARAIDLRHVLDTCAGAFGTTNPGEIVGQLLTVPERLASGQKAISALAKNKASAEENERMTLAKRLNALNLDGRPRSTIFADNIDDKTGTRTIALRPEYARMDLDVFRGLVAGLERGRTSKAPTPFQPSRERSEAAALMAAPQKVPAPDAAAPVVIAWAKQQPAFASTRKQLPAAITDEQIARQLAATMQPHRGVL